MKKIFINLLLLFVSLNLMSQDIFPYSINGCGSLNSVVGTIVINEDSGIQAIVTESFASIKFIDENNKILIYPNPSSDYINILCYENIHSDIFDISGKCVLSSNLNYIDISKLKKGVYFLKTKKANLKFIKL